MKLNLPEYNLKIRKTEDNYEIFDIVRAKYIILTPEEWVRQHFVHFLIEEKKVPKGLIRVEMTLQLNELTKRSDIVVHSKQGTPLLAVECKAPTVAISQDVFDQLARYNIVLQVPYLVVTNGIHHYYCKISNDGKYEFIPTLPPYSQL